MNMYLTPRCSSLCVHKVIPSSPSLSSLRSSPFLRVPPPLPLCPPALLWALHIVIISVSILVLHLVSFHSHSPISAQSTNTLEVAFPQGCSSPSRIPWMAFQRWVLQTLCIFSVERISLLKGPWPQKKISWMNDCVIPRAACLGS